jgi:hypothetical protein
MERRKRERAEMASIASYISVIGGEIGPVQKHILTDRLSSTTVGPEPVFLNF